jgi:hypothetical protein
MGASFYVACAMRTTACNRSRTRAHGARYLAFNDEELAPMGRSYALLQNGLASTR